MRRERSRAFSSLSLISHLERAGKSARTNRFVSDGRPDKADDVTDAIVFARGNNRVPENGEIITLLSAKQRATLILIFIFLRDTKETFEDPFPLVFFTR